MTPTEYQTQKNLARTLDRCADRAESIDRDPATAKQCWFLAGLILKAGEDGDEFLLDTSFVLTKRRASQMIDAYLN